VTKVSARPPLLPDFGSPPLKEVVLGVQFAAPKGYQQIHAGEVWNLYKSQYPEVHDQPALPPTFETFGLPHQQVSMKPQFGFITGGTHDRFWFLSSNGERLIQFQQDRLLHNWRKVGDGSNEYPRFESMRDEFRAELVKFQDYIGSLTPQGLSINQCEISYINHIRLDRSKSKAFSAWFNFLSFTESQPDDFSINFREIIKNNEGKPLGRLYVETAIGYLPDGDDVILLTLSVKGAPSATSIESAMDFFSMGRDIIVRRFTQLTTEQAHKEWELVN